MENIKQEFLNADYDYANQQVKFVNDAGEVRLTLPMSTIMEISNDIKPVYSVLAESNHKRSVRVSYVPIENDTNV